MHSKPEGIVTWEYSPMVSNYAFWENGNNSRKISATKQHKDQWHSNWFDIKITRWTETFWLFISARDLQAPWWKGSGHSIEARSIKMFSRHVAAVKEQIGFRNITKRAGRYSGTMNNEGFFLQRDWTPAIFPPERNEAGWKNPKQYLWESSKWGWSVRSVWEGELLAVREKDSQLWKAGKSWSDSSFY